MKYFDEIKNSMEWLSSKEDTIFLGQAVKVPGTFMYGTLKDINENKRIEMPVSESFQMQFSIGLALAGYVPISVYPRQNFLLLATGDMVNMLDKIPAISEGKVLPKMIIRVASGPFEPVHPGHQHIGNYADAFRKMFTWIDVFEVNEPVDIMPAYKYAYERNDKKATMIIENGNFYGQK